MKNSWAFSILVISLLSMAGVTGGQGSAQTSPSTGPSVSSGQTGRTTLAGIRNWGYQLQHADPVTIARSPYDLVVVDSTEAGDEESRFTPAAVKQMQTRPDGRRRIVLAYLSVGEAESYRFYWNDDWIEPLTIVAEGEFAGKGGKTRKLHIPRLSAPNWLGRENASWKGNYLVRYWDKGWQDIIFGQPKAYLERIIASGFDGVYLDRVDAFYGVTDERAEGKNDMVRFVTALARHARQLQPGFLIVPQNGEELLLESTYLASIDGIAKEDLLYGNTTEGQPNPPAVVANSLGWLAQASRQGLPVLAVEYVLEKGLADRLGAELAAKGFIPYFGVRSLDRLILPEDLKSAAAKAAAPAAAPAAPGKGRSQRQRNGSNNSGKK